MDAKNSNTVSAEIVSRAASRLCLVRIEPGQDLKDSLIALAERVAPNGAVIVTCVGSLVSARLRLAGASRIKEFEGPFEICTLGGTLSIDGVHLHISLADSEGHLIGGHLVSGNTIHTTAEVALAIPSDIVLKRSLDARTGYRELVLEKCRTPSA